jgi:hypothetical protein
MRLLALLLLLLSVSLQSYAYAEGLITNCEEPGTRFRVREDGDHYKLQLCTSRDSCIDHQKFIKLDKKHLCELCKTIIPEIEDESKTSYMYIYSVIILTSYILKRDNITHRL